MCRGVAKKLARARAGAAPLFPGGSHLIHIRARPLVKQSRRGGVNHRRFFEIESHGGIVSLRESSRLLSGAKQRIHHGVRVGFGPFPRAVVAGRASTLRTEQFVPSASLHPSPVVRGNQMMFDAESRAQAQLHYERTLARLRQREDGTRVMPPTSDTGGQTKSTIGAQIERLRQECDFTVEELAEEVEIDPTNVSRHIRGQSNPSRRSRRKYGRVFSKLLNREIVIRETQPKRS